MHGMYDMGRNPSIQLLKNNKDLIVLEVHNPRNITSDRVGCGLSNLYKNSVVDSWKLQNL